MVSEYKIEGKFENNMSIKNMYQFVVRIKDVKFAKKKHYMRNSYQNFELICINDNYTY